MVANLQHDASVSRLKLLELERAVRIWNPFSVFGLRRNGIERGSDDRFAKSHCNSHGKRRVPLNNLIALFLYHNHGHIIVTALC